jgi:hypothetical protein
MRNPFRAAAAALARHSALAVPLLAAALLAAPLLGAAPPPAPWIMTLQQVGRDGAAAGSPVRVTCPSTGCETTLPLVVGRMTGEVHVQVSFVAAGAYLTLVPRTPGLGAVVDYTTGYKGPIFAPLRRPDENTRLVQLLVAGAGDAGDPVLANGPVFNTKLRPDAYLRVRFERPPGTGK